MGNQQKSSVLESADLQSGIDALYASYESDTKPFLMSTDARFLVFEAEPDIICNVRDLMFPRYRNQGLISLPENRHHLEKIVEELRNLLHDAALVSLQQFPYALHGKSVPSEEEILSTSQHAVDSLTCSFGAIREMLKKDVASAYRGDPAAKDYTQIVRSYPATKAITIHRVSHHLYKELVVENLHIDDLPRELNEYSHRETQIDIHPGATIGEYFFIDHGTGVVIGETARIGNNVKLYQGVTLGAKSFPLDADGHPVKGIQRHPTIGNDVVIYAEATILGGKTFIGDRSIIGAGANILGDKVQIGNKVIIGAGATIDGGRTVIGDQSIIRGNVFLRKSVPPRSVVSHQSASVDIK